MTKKNVLGTILACSWLLASLGASASGQVMGDENRPRAKRPAARQEPRPGQKTKPAAGSHLDLVLQISEDGRAEVVRATELPGRPVLSDVPVGNYVYEVTKSGQTMAVESFGDPFERRSFPAPGEGPTSGHHLDRARTATVVVKVPATGLADKDLDRLAIRVHRIEGKQLEAVNQDGLAKLRQDGAVGKQWEMSGGVLASALRSKGRAMR